MANRVEGRLAGRFFKHGGPEGIEKPAPLPRQQHLFFRLEIVEKRSTRNACCLRDGFQRCPFITVGDKELQACFRDALERLPLFALAKPLTLCGSVFHAQTSVLRSTDCKLGAM